jgi:hypothetical protein
VQEELRKDKRKSSGLFLDFRTKQDIDKSGSFFLFGKEPTIIIGFNSILKLLLNIQEIFREITETKK